MAKFYLIQRGSFNKDLSKEFDALTGETGLIDLDYMGYAEFEFGAIPHAYRRIMHNRGKYDYHILHDIKDHKGQPFVIFCETEHVEQIKEELKRYIENPYRLKSFCCIRNHISGEETSTDFFWNIDINDIGDWMGWFGEDKLDVFKKTFDKDYNEWWMKKSEDEREKEYKSSLSW